MPPLPAVRVLSLHAAYRCQHTGRCCTSNWPIPIEPEPLLRLDQAVATGALRPASHTVGPWAPVPDGPALLGRDHDRCVFHDTHPSGGCRIQRTLGHEALPLSCRQFPRHVVTDPRGVSVTLSHYCPTARTMLDRAQGPTTIARHARGFPAHGEYAGLDAASALPPLLHPQCLLDWEAWWQIEDRAVRLVDEHPSTALPRLALAVEHLRTWRPGTALLRDVVHRAFDLAGVAIVSDWVPATDLVAAHLADALESVPAEWRAEAERALAVRAAPPTLPVIGRFLAAHVFANWTVHTGRGLRTWYRSIEAAGCLLHLTHDPGMVDLVLRHLAGSSALVERWRRSESSPVIRRP